MTHRRGLVGTFTALGAVLTLSSAAFACTVWKGKLSVTGNADSYATTATAHGKNTGMEHCAKSPIGSAKALATAGAVKIAIAPHDGSAVNGAACPAGQLADGWYDVRYLNGAAFTTDQPGSYRNWLLDCMNGSVGVEVSEVQVVSGTVALTSAINLGTSSYKNLPTDESAICVSGPGPSQNANQGASEGNQVPLTIV